MDDDFSEGSFERPGWIKDPETGDLLPIERDRRFLDALNDFYQAECDHSETTPMLVRIADGREQVYQCCVRCGERVGAAMSQKDKAWVSNLDELPATLQQSYSSRRNSEKQDILLRVAREQFAERGRFTHAYREYIASPGWKGKREKVLNRCSGICEGCGEEPATEVHHLSYRHFMNEFLFELVGLCHRCHERWHEGDGSSQDLNEGRGD